MVSSGTLYLLAAVVFLFYAWMKHTYGYWARRGIAFIKPLPLVGNMLPLIMQKQPFSKTLQDQYYELKPHKFGGTFAFMKPSLTLTDPEIIKEITVKSFDHFADRRFVINSRTDPLAHRVLICLKGKEWRDMRNLLSPVFTKSKLRGMFPLVSRCGEQFATFMAKQSDASNLPIEFKSATTRFANDIIATVAFGVECNSANNPKEEFYSFAQGISESILNNFRKLSLNAIGYSIVPKFMEFLDIPILPRSSSTFFRNIITSTKKHREENNITRPDMIQVLMSAQKGIVKKEQGEDHEHYVSSVGEGKEATDYYHKHLKTEKENTKKITDDDIAAQALVFFFAGYETVSVLLTFLAYELAVNPDIQRRLQEEIDTVISENGGQFTYDSLQEMKYLDMVISETLRKNPPAAFSDRMCTKDFQIPGTKITIEKGTTIMIPFYALHRDPEYFPDPNTFDPERFNEENKKNIKPYTYLPFGSGPHNCIGTRLALLEAQVCAVFLMASCDLQVCSKTQIPLQLSNKSFQMVSDAGCWLLCTPRENPSIKLDL